MTQHSNTLSVIIPVYNCQRFIAKTIASVVAQPQVTEIVVVDDGSTDQSWPLLKQLQQEFSLLKLYQHPKGVNKGRSATRNLGIQKATGDYVAFLDADDYYLENRFDNDFKIFESIPNCDGVYNAIGAHFYTDVTTELQANLALYTVSEIIKPQELFENLLLGCRGHFSIDGLTVKKTVFDKIGLFNEKLQVAEDTEIFWKMALRCYLQTGVIDKPLAIRGVHEANVFYNEVLYKSNYFEMLQSILIWASKNKIQKSLLDITLKQIWMLKHKQNDNLLAELQLWFKLFFSSRRLFYSTLNIKYFPLVRRRRQYFSFFYSK
ncbi:glycosyltransferase [Flavobacterium sp. K77]|uniref:glycosyltransferase family 2 protein n=1 Tax=Flavobacterium sp. K77 TaxID=2910676 RepID=UPI001F422A70|nr:glycosyltransferase family 2 protein [Flavobacterium sp. K77]MCF6141391.1 glycosyltransferase [Flavobacterium sp. K77]